MTKKIYTEIDIDFVKPNSDCDLWDLEYTCFECEHNQVREKYPYSYYEGQGVWTNKNKKYSKEEVTELIKIREEEIDQEVKEEIKKKFLEEQNEKL